MDLSIVDGTKLEIGKEYFAKYIHCKSEWKRIKISHYTENGHAWDSIHSGIITNGNYYIITNESLLEKFAKKWLEKKNFGGFANHTQVPKWFAQMYNDFEETKEAEFNQLKLKL